MSVLTPSLTEQNEPEQQFNNGIKLIISAFETQSNQLSSEITSLSSELELKNTKIAELEELLSSLLQSKEEYENTIALLNEKNNSITQQMDIIMEENKELKKVKETILATIEKPTISGTIDYTQQQVPHYKLHKSTSKTSVHKDKLNKEFNIDNI